MLTVCDRGSDSALVISDAKVCDIVVLYTVKCSGYETEPSVPLIFYVTFFR